MKITKRPSGPRKNNIQRSVLLPKELAEEARKIIPTEKAPSFNRLVTIALEELVCRHRELEFSTAMHQMARDSDIQKASRSISRDFEDAESDGL